LLKLRLASVAEHVERLFILIPYQLDYGGHLHLARRATSYVRIQRFVPIVSSVCAVPRGMASQDTSTIFGAAQDAKTGKVSINSIVRHMGSLMAYLVKCFTCNSRCLGGCGHLSRMTRLIAILPRIVAHVPERGQNG